MAREAYLGNHLVSVVALVPQEGHRHNRLPMEGRLHIRAFSLLLLSFCCCMPSPSFLFYAAPSSLSKWTSDRRQRGHHRP